MTTRAIAAAILAVLSLASRPESPPQTPVFHASTSMVSVDVSVRRGNVPVPGLTTADFTLTDSGVRQQIESIGLSEVPIDVSLVIDVSGSTAEQVARYRSDVIGIAAVLRPIDQLRVLTFGSDVDEILALTPAGTPLPVERIETRMFSSVYDGISAALLRTAQLGRRHLVVGFTDGLENRSILGGDAVVAIAQRTEAVLHLILPDTSARLPVVTEFGDKLALDSERINFQTGSPGSPRPMQPLVNTRTEEPRLEKAVLTTGGDVHIGSSMVDDFKKIFRDFTSSYVLNFHPTGVKSTGWHELAVKVKGGYTVHARRGYFADAK
jgi:VWFA-related protein